MEIQKFFDKLKLELQLLGLDIDDEFEKIEGREVNVTISGGEENLRVSFGAPGKRVSFTGLQPNQLALEIYGYLHRQRQMELWRDKPLGSPYGDSAKVKQHQQKVQEPPKRRVFIMGPPSAPPKEDWELTLDEFAGRYPEGMRVLREVSMRLRKLEAAIAAWRL